MGLKSLYFAREHGRHTLAGAAAPAVREMGDMGDDAN